jgi:hypothetical protein
MKRVALALLLLIPVVLVLCGVLRTRADVCRKVYLMAGSAGPTPRIDGVLGADEWPADGWENGLDYPWRDETAPETTFCVLMSANALYFAFRVADEDVVIAEGRPDDESLVARGDRVELFLARDPELDGYYSIEVDPRARVLDYQAAFYRRFDDRWDCPGLTAAARQRPGGYDVEGRIPVSALEEMGVAVSTSRPVLAGVFRAEFSHREGGAPRESWISWVRPDVAEPDFHVPSAFGCFRSKSE